MTTYILDSSAVLRYLDDEAGAERMSAIFRACIERQSEMRISAIQWGEIAGRLRKRVGASAATRALQSLTPIELEVVPVDAEQAVRAAILRLERGISYADGFTLDLAIGSGKRVLVTADYDFKAVAQLAEIEFLPSKSVKA